MITAKDLMNTDVISVDPDDTVEEVIGAMHAHALSGLPVVNMPGELLGFVSELDLMDAVEDPRAMQRPVYHHMTREVCSVDEDTGVDQLAERFRTLSVRRLPVVRGERLVGILSFHDLLGYVLRARRQVPRHLHDSHPMLSPPPGLDVGHMPHKHGHT